jgi:hypothetical protein
MEALPAKEEHSEELVQSSMPASPVSNGAAQDERLTRVMYLINKVRKSSKWSAPWKASKNRARAESVRWVGGGVMVTGALVNQVDDARYSALHLVWRRSLWCSVALLLLYLKFAASHAHACASP